MSQMGLVCPEVSTPKGEKVENLTEILAGLKGQELNVKVLTV